MAKQRATQIRRGFLGIESGGTRTQVHWVDEPGKPSLTQSFGPANLQLTTDRELARLFRSVRTAFPKPLSIAIGMAGARTDADHARLRSVLAAIWQGTPSLATNDLEIALAADTCGSVGEDAEWNAGSWSAHLLVLSGTGSCVYGRNTANKVERVGGWGHLLGDQGSGYAIALEALRAAIESHDRTRHWGRLGQRLLTFLHLNEPNALIGWIKSAPKQDVAALAPEVFMAAREKDAIATAVIESSARHLVQDALACATRLAGARDSVRFCLAGGVLRGQPEFADRVGQALVSARPHSSVVVLERSGAEGAAALARQLVASSIATPVPGSTQKSPPVSAPKPQPRFLPEATAPSPTEQRNPRSLALDRMSLESAIDLMLDEEGRALAALKKSGRAIARVIPWVHRALQRGGRLLYVGAGTSGRLGVLDASECPPTFRTAPEQVQGILAGGHGAMFRAAEGAEDDFDGGGRAITFRRITCNDVVIGIAASGRTPFVWGALQEARRRKARTVLLCFNPNLKFPRDLRPDLIIAPDLGPEVLTGSTRLKAGTATKWVLNLISTLSMVRLGKVVSNLMVDLNPSNAKLRDRAVRIVTTLTARSATEAHDALVAAGWRVPTALRQLGRVKTARNRSRGTIRRRR